MSFLNQLKDKKLFLLDLDGTLYVSEKIIGKTLEFLDAVVANGGKYMFLTNNSSKSVETYIPRLNKIGIKAAEDNFFTSAQATACYVEKNYGKDKRTYVVGTDSFKKSLVDDGFNIYSTIISSDCKPAASAGVSFIGDTITTFPFLSKDI